MRAVRGILIAVGLAFAGVGGLVLLADVPPERYLGIAAWVGAAIVLHDAVIAPVAVTVGLGAARARGRVGGRGVAVAQGALLVGAILTVIALPAIIASARGNANPTVLVGSYALSLAVAWALLVGVAAIAAWRSAARMRRVPQPPAGQGSAVDADAAADDADDDTGTARTK